MRWDEIDLEAAAWALPPTRTKNERAHVVPLPSMALALLTRRRGDVAAGRRTVFSGLRLTW